MGFVKDTKDYRNRYGHWI